MDHERSERLPIEAIAAFARGELTDEALKQRIKNDAESMELVHQIQTDDDFLTRLSGAWSDAPDGSGRSAPPSVDMVPGYRILGELHRGGQGTVYRAIQERTKRTVAIKVMHGGAAASSKARVRFEREVELVGSMRHPNIVTVFDGGELPDGGYFVAMEFIRGVPLIRAGAVDRQVDDKTRAELVRTKLQQFALICDAVQYAHLRGIIHRDLKPGNILLDRDGTPKVLDFGVAKVLGLVGTPDATMTGEFVGTFAYAAPEQVSGSAGDIDTRCDIYALGVVLYELLTNRFPYEISGPVSQTIHHITKTDPVPVSKVAAGLDHDLDSIVLTALAKDPDRRYQSAGTFAADVRHYLDGEPIEARSDSSTYLLGQLVRRYKAPIIIGCVAMLTLIGVSIWTSLLYVRAAQAEKEAEAGLQAALVEADKRASVIEVFTQIIESIRPERGASKSGREPTIRDMLDQASRQVEGRAVGRPDVVVAIQLALGRSYLSLGLQEQARGEAERALKVASRLDTESIQVAEAELLLGWLDYHDGDLDTAEERFGHALGILEATEPLDAVQVAHTLLAIASVQFRRSEYARSLELVERGLAIMTQAKANDLPTTVILLNHKVRSLSRLDSDSNAAEQVAMTALELCDEQGIEMPELITPMTNLAMIAKSRGDLAQAEALQDDALRICRRFYPPDHARIAGLLRRLGMIRQDQSNHALAEHNLRQAVEIYQASGGAARQGELARTMTAHGWSLLELGDSVRARARGRESLELLRGVTPLETERVAVSQALIGAAELELDEFDAARSQLLQAIDLLIQVGLQDSEMTLNSMMRLSRAFEGLDQDEEARVWRNRFEVAQERQAGGSLNREGP